jgi:hypothetical protein
MTSPTDRGFAIIDSQPDGTTTISICAEVVHHQPVGVFAQYTDCPFAIDQGVAMTKHGQRQYSIGVVEVHESDGVVNIRTISERL